MRYLVGLVCILTIGVMGCSETSGGSGSGGEAGTGGMAGEGGTGGANLTAITVRVYGWAGADAGGSLGPQEGVKFCEVGTDYCVMSDSEGWVTLQLPTSEEVAFSMVKKGYMSYLSAGVVPEVPIQLELYMATDERAASLHDRVKSPYPMEGTGDILIIRQSSSPFPGATLELVGASGKVFYYDEDGYWDPDLTATSSIPDATMGGFTEVAPGEVEVTWGGTAEGCSIFKGWPSDKENTMRIPVMEGFISQEDLLCATVNGFDVGAFEVQP